MERRTVGQDKYSTEILIQGYNSSLTMLVVETAEFNKSSSQKIEKGVGDDVSLNQNDLMTISLAFMQKNELSKDSNIKLIQCR